MILQTKVDGKITDSKDIEDPFHTTRVVVGWNIKDWIKALFKNPRQIEIEVKVIPDNDSYRRWFNENT